MNEKINSAQRALRVIKVLQNNSFVGLSNKEIAQALNESPTNISRTLDVLKNEGFVIKLESGKFAFSSLFAQIAMRHAANMDKASAQINEMKQRHCRLLRTQHDRVNNGTTAKCGLISRQTNDSG